MIFRLTERAQEKLKTGRLSNLPESSAFEEWYLDLLYIGRHRFFITTNAATLVTVIISGTGINSESDYFDALYEAMEEQFSIMSCPFIFRRNVVPKMSDIILSDCSRKAAKSMDDVLSLATQLLQINGLPPAEASRAVNETPFKIIRMESPADYIKKYRLYR